MSELCPCHWRCDCSANKGSGDEMATNPTAESREQMIAALERSAADTCSVHCPSVKYTTTPKPEDGDGWPHHERCHQARAAIAALRAPERGTWQDISTAPKDGRFVLGWCRQWRDDVIAVRWLIGLNRWHTATQPTHWMPLPDPPVTRKEPS